MIGPLPMEASRSDPWDDDEPFNPWPTIHALWQRKWIIVAGTVAAAAGTFLVSLAMPRQYTTLATVFVTPPTLENDLKPEPFSVEGFERLADSDFIKNRVAQDLRQKKVLGPDEGAGRLDTVIYPSKEPQKPFLPIIGLQVVGYSPEKVQAAANTWAMVLVEEEARISAIGKSGAVDFVLQEFPKASSQLLGEEQKLKQLGDQHARVMTAAESRHAISLVTAQLESVERQVVEFEAERRRAHVAAQEAKESIPRLEAEIARTPPLVTTSKSLAGARLTSEEINPVYQSLSQSLADARIAYDANVAKEGILAGQVRDGRAQAATLRGDLLNGQQAIADLERLQTVERANAERGVSEARSRFDKLNERIGDAQIVKAQLDSDLKIGALAERPQRSSSPDPVRNAELAAPIGLLLSVFFTWLAIEMKQHPAPTR